MVNRYGTSPTVLLVCDSNDIVTLRWALESDGYHVIETATVQDALEVAWDFTLAILPDVILVRLCSTAQGDFSAVDLLHNGGIIQGIPVLVVSRGDITDEVTARLAAECVKHGASFTSSAGMKNTVHELVKTRAATA
jgi:hypothetical protein